MNLIWTKEQRPSTDLFQNEPNLVANETSEFLLLPRLNVTDPGGNGEDGDIGDYFVGIVPEQKGNHEYTFEIYRIDCRRWINDKWVLFLLTWLLGTLSSFAVTKVLSFYVLRKDHLRIKILEF